MVHLKKNKMPRTWPVQRKKDKFVAVPSHATSKGISILFLLRDILNIAKTRKEAKFMTLNGLVKVNDIIRKNENFPVQVNDSFSLVKSEEYYRLEIMNKRYTLKKISEKDSQIKIIKISGKKSFGKDSTQMSLRDGQNIITKESFSIGDSVIFNSKERKIVKILPLKIGAKIEIVVGKHAGKKGKLVGFEDLSRGRDYKVKLENKEVILPFKTILVIE